MNPSSTAAVATACPGRYGKQVAAHLEGKVPAGWDADSATGRIIFPTAGLALRRATDPRCRST